MNGFILLVVLAATAQVAAPAPTPSSERDYGWQISEDGALEFIVQLSPEKANFMVANNKEFQSLIPADVAVRISRVVVCIGRDPILSTPMEEVLKLPVRTTAVLANIESVAGRGRFSDLESSPSGGILNVGGNNAQPPLSNSAPAPLPGAASLGNDINTLGTNDLISALPNALRQGEELLAQNGSSNFMNDARGVGTGANTGKFSNTGTPPPTALPAAPGSTSLPTSPIGSPAAAPTMPSFPTSPALQTAPPTPGMSPIGTNGGLGATNPNNVGNYQQQGNVGNPGYTGAPIYNDPYARGAGTTAPTNTGNFGTPPRSAAGQTSTGQYATTTNPWGTTGTGNGYTQPPYNGSLSQSGGYQNLPSYNNAQSGIGTGNSMYANDPMSLPGSPNYRVADNRDVPGLPTTSGGSSTFPPPTTGLGTSNFPVGSTDTRQNNFNRTTTTTTPITDPNYAAQYPGGRSGMENIVPVMFVLSLVVNFYLGMLIRKLLARYRSLLSSVRSQTV